MAAIEVTMLGTGSPIPDANRAGPATLVRAGGQSFLVDCGRGVLMRATAAGAAAAGLTATLLTHLHSDHLTDLNDVITTRWITSFAPLPLRLLGPPGVQAVVDGLLDSLRLDVGYRLAHHDDLTWEPPVEVEEVGPGVVHHHGDVRIVAAATDHRPVQPTVGYRFEHAGHAVVLAGDTVPCPGLDELCAGADALVITVVRHDLIEQLGIGRLIDVCDYHSTVEQAADTAARAGVDTLVLTHCVPPIPPGGEDEWRALAAARFDGEVVVAADLDRVEVG
ncbi:MAG: ribonuclease Z [Acidimicrobiia bacterium]